MNRLTKTQVLALFLGATSAADKTLKDLFNGPTSTDTVPAEQTLRTASSGTECANNDGCGEGEKCGKAQLATLAEGASQPAGLCLAEDMCGAMGKLNGVQFYAPCFETGEAPAEVDVATYFTELESLITKKTVNFDDEVNLLISPMYNYQDGWWVIDGDGKYDEVDKSADNRCFVDGQCEVDAGECCGSWPDSNNLRCMQRSLHGKVQTAGPASFTPRCREESGEDVVPENAQDDIAKGALSEASEELTKFFNAQKEDAQKNAGYADMTEDEQKEWDEAYEAGSAKRDEFKKEMQTLIGYDEDTCDDACKAVFEEEFLTVSKKKYEACKDSTNGIKCREADALIKAQITAMKGDGEDLKNFFSGMTKEERESFNESWKEKEEKEAVNLAAAWVKENKPSAGENGSACDEEGKCGDGMCCGVSSPKESDTGLPGLVTAIVNESTDAASGMIKAVFGEEAAPEGSLPYVCVKVPRIEKGQQAEWTNALGVDYTHTCQAIAKLASSVAAAGAALYYM